jgi:Uma2 family endonuclease
MSSAAKTLRVSFADFIAAEAKSDRKHQLVDGEVFDMGGGTLAHARLILTVGSLLHAQLRGRPCSAFSSEARVRAGTLVTYPDCTVVCGEVEVDPEDANTLRNPTLLVEVLSEGTEAFDRGAKAEEYRRIPSLREYLFVSQQRPHVELYRRTERAWELLEVGMGERLRLESIGCWLDVDSVYEGVLDPAG